MAATKEFRVILALDEAHMRAAVMQGIMYQTPPRKNNEKTWFC
jgi:hypothetical protein